MKIVKHIENEQGMALVTTMLFLVILFFLGVAAYMMTSSDLRISGYYRLSQNAFYVAESGIEDVRGRMKKIYIDEVLDLSDGDMLAWRYYIGDSTLVDELTNALVEPSSSPDAGSLSGMYYAVQLRLKNGADPNSVSGGADDEHIIYWNGSTETDGSSGSGSYPIFIATSLGAKGDARKKIIAEIRGTAVFAPAPAALFVNGDLTKNGDSGHAQGAWGSWWPVGTEDEYGNPMLACPPVPDVMTTTNASPGSDANAWPADTSADGPMSNHPQIPPQPPTPTDEDMLQSDLRIGVREDYYPFADVVAMVSSSYDQKVTSGTNLELGTHDNPGIFYSDTDLSVNGLNGYGILVIGKLDANGNPDTSINFTAGGNIEWHGLIVTTGQSVFNGGGVQQIYGSMIANAVTTVNGQPDFLYDCTFLNSLESRSPKFQVYSWKEDSL